MPNMIYFINRKTGELTCIFSDIEFTWHFVEEGKVNVVCKNEKADSLILSGFERVSGERYKRYRKSLYWKLKRYFNKVGR